MNEYILFMKSCGAGLITFGIVIVLGAILDIFINVKISNFIAVLIGLISNYLLQERIFKVIAKPQNFYFKLSKYIIVDLTILILNSILFNILTNLKDKIKLPTWLEIHYATLCRVVVGLIIWVFVSFPLRRYFIF